MKITVNYPNRPKGAAIEISHLGLFGNGEEHTLTSDTVEVYASRGYNLPEDGVFGEPLADSKNKPVSGKHNSKTEVKE